jgi:hypothetical protein
VEPAQAHANGRLKKMQIHLLKPNDPLTKTLETAKKTYITANLILEETKKQISKLTTPYGNK